MTLIIREDYRKSYEELSAPCEGILLDGCQPPTEHPRAVLHDLYAPILADTTPDELQRAVATLQQDTTPGFAAAASLLNAALTNTTVRAIATGPAPTREERHGHVNKKLCLLRTYAAGYEVHLVELGFGFEMEPVYVQTAFTPDGKYIGSPRDAHWLVYKHGIAPEYRTPTSTVCSIGFSAREQKWYGWSHRAMFGFGIGHTVTPDSVAYVPSTREEYIAERLAWHTLTQEKANVTARVVDSGPEEDQGIFIEFDVVGPCVRAGESIGDRVGIIYPLDRAGGYGRGTWTAATLDDARIMACDFAEDIS